MHKNRNISGFELLGVFSVSKEGGEGLEEFFSGNGVASKLSKGKSAALSVVENKDQLLFLREGSALLEAAAGGAVMLLRSCVQLGIQHPGRCGAAGVIQRWPQSCSESWSPSGAS